MFELQNSELLYFYRPMDAAAQAVALHEPDTFLHWVTTDGCTPVYGPDQKLWGLRCPRFHF